MRISKHAELRMAERNITREMLIECINNCQIKEHRTDCRKKVLLGKKVIMIVSADGSEFITCFHNEWKRK